MSSFVDQAILALYIPIVAFSGTACWLYITRVLWPAIIRRHFTLKHHAVALAATFALLAHFTENVYYGIIRIDDRFVSYMGKLEFIAPMKLIILFSSILAVAVYNKAVFGAQNLLRLNMIALVLWLGSWIVLLWLNH